MGLIMKTALLFFLLFCTSLFADQKDYLLAMEYYKAKEYKKAFEIIFNEAQEENRAAQYRLAEMYENGRGTEVDYQQAMYWYKLSSSRYAYVESDEVDEANASFISDLIKQFGSASIERGNEYALAKMDTDTPETKRLLKSVMDEGFFGLQPYETNYLLPISYGKDKPPRISSSSPVNDSFYDQNTEVEFQFSLKKQLSYNLFGFNEYINVAYTQKVWWQLYTDSGPFRETNYLPEFFVSVPTSQTVDDVTGLKAVKVGFLHESNGQEGYRSRSWNRIYLTGLWQWKNLFLATRAWYRIPESEKSDGYYDGLSSDPNESGDDNPDIEKYLGYGDIRIDYLYKNSHFGLLFRNNLRMNGDNKGAVELNYSHPITDSANTFLYIKLFNGYGESLIDYNRNVTKAAIGFSFSRGLF
jgi:phospholipase A1/A2